MPFVFSLRQRAILKQQIEHYGVGKQNLKLNDILSAITIQK
jgi:hypothetical protein